MEYTNGHDLNSMNMLATFFGDSRYTILATTRLKGDVSVRGSTKLPYLTQLMILIFQTLKFYQR